MSVGSCRVIVIPQFMKVWMPANNCSGVEQNQQDGKVIGVTPARYQMSQDHC